MIEVKLFHDPWCEIGGDCLPVDDIIELIRDEFANVQLDILTMDEDVDSVIEYGIMNTPAMVIDGQLAFHGSIDRASLRERLRAVQA